MIICSKCAKENQDHYKFCLGCGSELPRDAAPKPFAPRTPPHGIKAISNPPRPLGGSSPPANSEVATRAAPQIAEGAASVMSSPTEPPAAAVGGGGQVKCPQCEHANNPSNLFCGSCGYRLQAASVGRIAAQKTSLASPQEMAPASSVTLTALRADGSEAGSYQVPAGTANLGRESGGIFASDSYLSPKHASIRSLGGGRAIVRDEGSLNGVYRKLQRDTPEPLVDGDVFRIGQEILKFELLKRESASAEGVERFGSPRRDYAARISLVIGRNQTGNAFVVPASGAHIGRERGDMLFPEDGYVSGLHCHIAPEGDSFVLIDLGSSNGSYLRLREEVELQTGDVLLMGQQLYRVNITT